MLQVDLLGRGGMVPLPGRFLTSLLARCQGSGVLIDCGEGTQIAVRAAGLGFKQIDVICLTHFHADHIAGLPGLLLTIGNSGRTEPLLIIGPRHLEQVVACLRIIAPQLPFEVLCREIEGDGAVYALGALTISCQAVQHWIPCYAYRLDLSRRPRFDAARARALEIPVQLWSVLQSGEPAIVDGRRVEPSEVLGPDRRGLRLTYATDLRPSDALAEFAAESDLFVCEGMYGDPQMRDKALEHRHCLFSEAASMAGKARAKELWLTHFSPSMPNPREFLQAAADQFPNVSIDKSTACLRFPD